MTDDSEWERYDRAWELLQKRHRLLKLAWSLHFWGGLACLLILLPTRMELFIVVAAVLAVLYPLTLYLLDTAKCPRCGHPYARKRWREQELPEECASCGLPFGAEPGEHEDEE
jgi:hypothetical protein